MTATVPRGREQGDDVVAAAASDVFVSYSRRDEAFVRRLHDALATRGKEIWVDWEDILPTAEWRPEIEAGIDAADAFVFVISPDSLVSPVCRHELEHALARGKRIVPLVHREPGETPMLPELESRNWVFVRDDNDFDAGVTMLVEALELDLDAVRMHTRILRRAADWEARSRDRSLLLRGGDLREAERWLAQAVDAEPRPTQLQSGYVAASRRAAAGRQRTGWTVAIGVLAGLAATTVFALVQRSDAIGQAKTAGSRALAQASIAQLGVDPELALLLALRATDERGTAQANAALRRAVFASHVRATVQGQPDVFRNVVFTPDGQRLATIDEDGTVQLSNARTGAPLHEIRGPRGVRGRDPWVEASVSADGSRAVTVGRTAAVRDLRTGRLLRSVHAPHGRQLEAADFAGNRLITLDTVGAYSERPVSRMWDVGTGRALAHRPGTFLSASRDGSRLLFAAGDAAVVTDQLGRVIGGLAGTVGEGMLSADGSEAVTVSYDHVVTAWRVAAPHRLRRLTEPNMSGGSPVAGTSTAISDNGRLVATAVSNGMVEGGGGDLNRGDKTIRVWNAATGRLVAHLKGHTAVVPALAFSHGDRLLASGSDDRSVRVWDVRRGAPVAVLRGHTGAVTTVAFDRNGARVASAADDGTARVWEVVADPVVASYSGTVVPSENGAFVAVVERGSTTIFRTVTGRSVGSVPVQGSADELLVAPSGSTLVVRRSLWDATRHRRLTRLSRQPVVFGRDGRTLVTAGRLVDAQLGAPTTSWREPGVPTGAGLSADRRALVTIYGMVSYGVGGYVPRLRSGRTGALLHLLGSDGDAYAVDVSPDGALAAIARDGTTQLWNLATGRLIRTLRSTPSKLVLAVRFSHDGTRVASGGWDTVGRIWDVGAEGTPIQLAGHRDSILHLEFARGDDVLLTVGGDGTARLWDTATGDLLHTLRVDGTAGFTPDGQHVFTLDTRHEPNVLQVYECAACGDINDVRRLAERRAARPLTAAEQARFVSSG